MIKKSKQIEKMINQLIKTAFRDNGSIDPDQVNKHVKSLKALPVPQSIIALSEYLRKIKNELQKTTLEIESAFPLTSEQIKRVTDAIKADHQVTAVKSIINSSLLGGVRVKIGDSVYDDSVARRILQLGEEIRS